MNNFKRRFFQRKNDGAVVALGTLTAKDVLQVEVWNSESKSLELKEFHLTGKLSETETNDVFVLGKVEGNEITVLKLVDRTALKSFSLTKSLDAYGLSDPIGIYVSDAFKSAEEKTSKGGGKYHAVKFNGGENTTVILNTYGFSKLDEGEKYILVTSGEYDTQTSNFKVERGENAGQEVEWKTVRGFALTQMV